MKRYNMRINFFWDDEDDMREFVIIVPINVTIAEIEEELIKVHKFLDREDTTDFYGIYGRTPETLIDFVCQKNRWTYTEMDFDIDMNFN